MPKITPGKLYCGSCDTLREFVDGDALDAHVQAMHRGGGTCDYCGHEADSGMVWSGDIDIEVWCVDELACDERAAMKDSRP